MEPWVTWLALGLGAAILGTYELRLWRTSRRDPSATARSAHGMLRAEWVRALSRTPGTELLAVQTLRNSLMSATITASTAALTSMGAVSLLASKVDLTTIRLDRQLLTSSSVLEVSLLGMLFAAFVCSAMAARYYHHTGFILSLPVGSSERTRNEPVAVAYVQRAGVLYSWSLRCFFFLAPVVVGLLSPLMMPPAALVLVALLRVFDNPPSFGPSWE